MSGIFQGEIVRASSQDDDSINEQPEKTVSFVETPITRVNTHKGLKRITDAIEQCENMQVLDLRGMKISVDTAGGIAEALEKSGRHLKNLHWPGTLKKLKEDDLDTAMMRLSHGICLADAYLTELDFSENNLGPRGMEAVCKLLTSTCCLNLRVLKLNQNHLGEDGAKCLAKAMLTDPNGNMNGSMSLHVFEAAQNKFDDESVAELAEAFKRMRSLEELRLERNKIGNLGVAALARSLLENPNLKILNLNNNKIGLQGAKALAEVLPDLKQLQVLRLLGNTLTTAGSDLIGQALGLELDTLNN
ncbi:ran GTPase-activating protein 1-like [Trichogramma pretiosum]|uniref:ran GTPase-activating protein 1-like n=1 Tax=Trichogramma pretiosum TaxID=7493 RepID=UPI0006C9746C|nr:ran GTPase-activating protein 1-like [Trichogramma pretiosum]